jgi:hypothetical protein
VSTPSFPTGQTVDEIEAAGDHLASQCGFCGRRHWGACELDMEAVWAMANEMHRVYADHADTTARNPLCSVCARRAGVWLRFLGLGPQCAAPSVAAQTNLAAQTGITQ